MFEKEIEKGVIWLNKNYPGWESKIDVDELDMESAYCCVLGQLGNYKELTDKLHENNTNQFECGFSLFPGIGSIQNFRYKFDDLTKEWKDKILSLRKEC